MGQFLKPSKHFSNLEQLTSVALPENGLQRAILALEPCYPRASPRGHFAHCKLSHDASDNSFRFLQFHYQALWEENRKKNQYMCWPEKQRVQIAHPPPPMKPRACPPAASQTRAAMLPGCSGSHIAWSDVGTPCLYQSRQFPQYPLPQPLP